MPNGKKRFGHKVSCMCDIPFKDLRIHTLRYGEFGIAFNKEKAIQEGQFNPVWYFHHENKSFEKAEGLLEQTTELIKSSSGESSELFRKFDEFLLFIGTYFKRGDLTRKFETDPKLDKDQCSNFYYEREWRSDLIWNFNEDAVEAIMVPKRYIPDLKEHLRTQCKFLENKPILSHELIALL